MSHGTQNVLYSLRHFWCSIPPPADAWWVGEADQDSSCLDPGSGGPANDFANCDIRFMTWNLPRLARILTDNGGIPGHDKQRGAGDAGGRFGLVIPEYR